MALLLLQSAVAFCSIVELRTTARVGGPSVSPRALTEYLATPRHWPQIVLSSVAVVGDDVDRPLRRGARVDEVFGAPPLLPLSVTWTCECADASAGVLDVRSPDGLAGVARNCRMLFAVTPAGGASGGCDVLLSMCYEPASPLALLAVPLLAADNWLALNVLLPAALTRERSGGAHAIEQGGACLLYTSPSPRD